MGIRESAPFGLLLREELKARLARKSQLHGRRQNSEIANSLKANLGGEENDGRTMQYVRRMCLGE